MIRFHPLTVFNANLSLAIAIESILVMMIDAMLNGMRARSMKTAFLMAVESSYAPMAPSMKATSTLKNKMAAAAGS